MKNERGFSMIKMMFWVAVISAAVWSTYMILPVYNAYWKVQDAFESVSKSMANESEVAVRNRLPGIFNIKYLVKSDLPEEFYTNLVIEANGNQVEISSSYGGTVWLLGPVEKVDTQGNYKVEDLKGMDKIRHKARFDYDFKPYGKTP